jgi:hypothetical protein
MPTSYDPHDGDYIDADYTKLLNDAQAAKGIDIGKYLEICVSLTEDNEIYVQCANDNGDEWIVDHTFAIPDGWSIEEVRDMFPGNVYLRTCP